LLFDTPFCSIEAQVIKGQMRADVMKNFNQMASATSQLSGISQVISVV
jgi:hypothetical protein